MRADGKDGGGGGKERVFSGWPWRLNRRRLTQEQGGRYRHVVVAGQGIGRDLKGSSLFEQKISADVSALGPGVQGMVILHIRTGMSMESSQLQQVRSTEGAEVGCRTKRKTM